MAAEGRRRLRAAVGAPACSCSRFWLDFRLARWGSLSIGGGSRPARAIYFLWIGAGRATPRRRLAARAPAPPLWVTLLCALRNCSASTISVTLTRARGASRFQIAVSFFGFSSATESTAPRSDGAGRADCAAGAAAEQRRHRRWPPGPPRRRRGLRRVLALDFQAGFPAGAVVFLIHWRWQPTGAGDLAIIGKQGDCEYQRPLLNFV